MSDQTSEPDMPAMPAATHAYFATGAEQRRFEQNPLEFERHKQIFSERLPTEGHVLDVGGGPGAYASLLASQGYEVDLIDPVPLHIEQAQDAARRGPAFDAHLGDARHLEFPDATVDAVLLMGPLYYLEDSHERCRSLLEAYRVLRPGGVLLASALGRLSRFLSLVRASSTLRPDHLGALRRTLDTGVMESGGLRLYAHRPDELVRELTAAGFETVEAIAVDVGVPGAALISRMLEEPESRANLLTILHDVESDPGILGFAEKLIAVGHRPLPD